MTLIMLIIKTCQLSTDSVTYLLLTGSEERGVLRVSSIPVAILPSRQDMKTIAFFFA